MPLNRRPALLARPSRAGAQRGQQQGQRLVRLLWPSSSQSSEGRKLLSLRPVPNHSAPSPPRTPPPEPRQPSRQPNRRRAFARQKSRRPAFREPIQDATRAPFVLREVKLRETIATESVRRASSMRLSPPSGKAPSALLPATARGVPAQGAAARRVVVRIACTAKSDAGFLRSILAADSRSLAAEFPTAKRAVARKDVGIAMASRPAGVVAAGVATLLGPTAGRTAVIEDAFRFSGCRRSTRSWCLVVCKDSKGRSTGLVTVETLASMKDLT